MTIEKIARDCGTIVLTDSLSFYHQPERLDAFIEQETGSSRYDLLSLPKLERYHGELTNVLAGDIATAISLHRNERIYGISQTSEALEAILSDVQKKLPAEIRGLLKQNIHQLTTSDLSGGNLESDTLVITCMDWRLHGAAGGLFKKLGEVLSEDPTEFDLLATAGGGKGLLPNTPRWDLIQDKLGTTKPKRIVVLSHTDCGAYGGNSAFDSNIQQLQALTEGLRDALETLIANTTDGIIKTSDTCFDVVTGIVHLDEENDCVERVQLFT